MKFVFLTAGIIIFIAFILPLFQDVFNFGNIGGILLAAAYIVTGFMYDFLGKEIQCLVIILAVAVPIIITALFAVIMLSPKRNKNADVVIVLGCRVKGFKPSLALVKRVERAYEYLLKNPRAVAVLSGGQGKDECVSEAFCMKQLLTEKGIDEARLICEDRSTTTDENIRFSLEIIDELELKKEVTVVTSDYHSRRAELICKRYGLDAGSVSSRTPPALLPAFLLREILAIIKELVYSNIQNNSK